MSFLSLQPAIQADLPAIVEIYNSSIATRQSTADLEPVSVAQRQAWFDAHSETRPIYVLKNTQGDVLAWGSFSDYYPRAAYKITAEISIYVHINHQGKGFGKWVLSEMLKRTSALGICNVVAVIFGHNVSSIALFKHFGFQHWGTLPAVCKLDNRLADVVILGLTLTIQKE